MRLMFVSRSSLLKPSPLLRLVRTSSPSRISTLTPRRRSSSATRVENVDLPAPESPVNHSVNPLCSIAVLSPARATDGKTGTSRPGRPQLSHNLPRFAEGGPDTKGGIGLACPGLRPRGRWWDYNTAYLGVAPHWSTSACLMRWWRASASAAVSVRSGSRYSMENVKL